MEINSYQERAEKTNDTGKSSIALYGLAGEIGGLFSLFKKRLRDRQPPQQFRDDLREELGDILWYLSALASHNGIKLEDVATTNLEKISLLFGSEQAPFFDDNFPPAERLPNNLKVRFTIDSASGRSVMLFDGIPMGDPLSDNVLIEDNYKFHDVFHLAFLAHLHWSPVLRSLLKRKRKSVPLVDENEDGARAAILEEAVIGIIFSYAEQNAFFEDKRLIPFSLIKILQRLTSKYEVSKCTAHQWRDAIYEACAVFVQIAKHQGGFVSADAIEGRIEYTL